MCWFFSLLALLLVAFGKGDQPVSEALERLWDFFKQRWYLGVLMAIYLAQFYQWAYEGLADAILLREWLFGTTPFDTIKL